MPKRNAGIHFLYTCAGLGAVLLLLIREIVNIAKKGLIELWETDAAGLFYVSPYIAIP